MEIESYFGDEGSSCRTGKFLVLVIYDISEQKQRNRMVKYLEGFGYRVQKSAFESWLNEGQFAKLCSGLDRLVHTNDHVRVYRLRGASNVYSWGETPDFETEDVIII